MSDLILGVSGLRGIVGETLTPEVAVRYAQAFGAWLRERGVVGEVVVGRDGRKGGEAICEAAIAGLNQAGLRVRAVGVAMTPTVAVAVDQHRAGAGMVVTASHNPQQWNGLKAIVREGAGSGAEGAPMACAPSAQAAGAIIEAFGSCGPDGPDDACEPRRLEDASATALHVRRVLDAARVKAEGLCAVVDSVNASGAAGAVMLLESLGVTLGAHVGGDASGVFPHTPEPTAENLSGEGGLCDAVPGVKADVGFAQDPDGDRLAIVGERGRYIGEEYTLAIAAEAILGAMGDDAKGAVLVTNLSTSRMVEDVAAAYGARVERTPVGEANVVERMKALRAAGERVVLGGEGNGGVIWPEVTYVRDSLGAMALTLGLMARAGLTVSGVVEKIDGYARGGKYAIVKRKQAIEHKADADPAVERVAAAYAGERVDRQDGVRVDFTGQRAGSWVHVRASNTEPIMRLIAEAPGEAAAGEILDGVARVIAGG